VKFGNEDFVKIRQESPNLVKNPMKILVILHEDLSNFCCCQQH